MEMINSLKLLSPYFLVIMNVLIYFMFTMINPNYYSNIIQEPDLMYFDFQAMLFVFSCLLGFFIGVSFVGRKSRFKTAKLKIKKIIVTKKFYFMMPLTISFLLLLLLTIEYIINNSNILIFIMLGDANIVKKNAIIDPWFMRILYVALGSIYWSYYIYSYKIFQKTIFKILLYLAIFLVILVSILLVARYLLLPFIVSLLLIKLSSKKHISYSSLTTIVIGIIIIFSLFSLVRGGDIIHSILGYGPASFNRLSYVLEGEINFKQPLFYIATFLGDSREYLDVLVDEHNAIGNSGLDWYLNWITVYGYIYMSLKWFSFVYFFFLGIISKFFWNGFMNGYTVSIVIYPWIFTSVLLFFSSNMLSWGATLIFIFTGILIFIYSKIFKYKVRPCYYHSL